MNLRRLMFPSLGVLLAMTAGTALAQGFDENKLPPVPTDAEVAREIERAKTEEAIGQYFDGIFPVSPEQIRAVRSKTEEMTKVQAERFGPAPKADSRSINVSLDNAEAPVRLYLIGDYLSSVSFFDASGKPWPFVNVVNSSQKVFELGDPLATIDTEGKGSHTLYIKPLRTYGHGNALVYLAGSEVPLMLDFVLGEDRLDAKATINIQSFGPNFEMPIASGQGVPDNSDPVLDDVSAGIGPVGSVPVELVGVSSSIAKAWRVGGALYVRSAAKLLGPSWLDQKTNGNYRAYKLSDTPPVHSLWMTYNGQEFDVKVEG